MILAHIFLAARNFAISSTKPLCALKKNDILCPISFGSNPLSIADSIYAIPLANVNANS